MEEREWEWNEGLVMAQDFLEAMGSRAGAGGSLMSSVMDEAEVDIDGDNTSPSSGRATPFSGYRTGAMLFFGLVFTLVRDGFKVQMLGLKGICIGRLQGQNTHDEEGVSSGS